MFLDLVFLAWLWQLRGGLAAPAPGRRAASPAYPSYPALTVGDRSGSATVYGEADGTEKARPAGRRSGFPAASAAPGRPGLEVTATIYHAEAGQTDADPLVTADNSRIGPGHDSRRRWLAVSRDLLASGGGRLRYGDSLRVSGISARLDGTYVVHDTMNRRLRRRIDLLVHRREQIYGKWAHVRIQRIPRTQPLLSPPVL